jgi:hypothetical protein
MFHVIINLINMSFIELSHKNLYLRSCTSDQYRNSTFFTQHYKNDYNMIGQK